MNYHNELVFSDAWGYDEGNPTDLNNPDNYEVIEIKKKHSTKRLVKKKIGDDKSGT